MQRHVLQYTHQICRLIGDGGFEHQTVFNAAPRLCTRGSEHEFLIELDALPTDATSIDASISLTLICLLLVSAHRWPI